MKKAISFVLMICLATTLFAGPVSRETALKVAQKVFNSSPATKGVVSTSLSITWDGEFEATRGVIDPAFYVVSRDGGGFVIVSGNDNIQPVLAFSFENPFKVEDMPANVRWWMEELKGYARSAAYPSARALEEWAAYTDTKAVIPPAQIASEFTGSRTNLWNQTDPANLYVPKVDVQASKSVCGCVPLAFSEIMAWFGTNNKNTYSGEIPAYTYQAANPGTGYYDYEQSIPAHSITATHDWGSLKLLANTDPDDFYVAVPPISEDLGHLVYDVGTILQVQYNMSTYGGTSGNLGRIEQLATMMGYAKNALPKRRENYSGNEWVSMLTAEIDNHPVYYEGEDVTTHGGHAFVADGYATTTGGIKVIHFNFGWGGSCNGYYDCLTDLDDGHYNFFLRNVALFGFVPDLSATTSVVKKLSYFCYDGVDGGLFHTGGTIDYDPTLTFKNVQNLGSTDYTGFIYCYRVDKAGAPQGGFLFSVGSFGEGDFPVLGYLGSCDIDPYVSFTPVLGDKYALFYRDENDTLTPLEGDQVGRILTEVPLFPAAFIKTEATYAVGDYFVFALTNHNYQYYDATWTITTPGGVSTDYAQQDNRAQLTAAGDYKIEVTIPGQEKVTAYIHVN